MKSSVVDSSFFVRSIIPHPDQISHVEKIAEWKTDEVSLYAPMLWHYEVASSITKSLHFKQITAEQATASLLFTEEFDIVLVPPNREIFIAAYEWTLKLRRASAYDSFYLALAQAIGTDFWTADKKLYNAVGTDWIHMLES
ncbi:MAG: type II toxin-antitoxin system VapC family toxin [Chloroflexota bacterium]